MLKFILGAMVGSIVGFVVCAICSVAGTDNRIDAASVKEIGDSDASSK